MAITGGRSAATAQTIGAAYERAFDATTHSGGADLVEIKCVTESITCKINGGTEFEVAAGETKYRRARSFRGIISLDVKRTASTDATLVWDVDVIAGG